MQINAKLLSLGLIGVVALLLYLMIDQCSRKKGYKDQLDVALNDVRLYKDSTSRYRIRSLECENQVALSKGQILALKQSIAKKQQDVAKRLASMTTKGQAEQTVKNYVDDGLLAPRYLSEIVFETDTVYKVDSAIIRAAATTSEWLKIYKSERDSLEQSVALYVVENQTCKEDLGDCRQEVMRLQAVRQRKRGIFGKLVCWLFGCRN